MYTGIPACTRTAAGLRCLPASVVVTVAFAVAPLVGQTYPPVIFRNTSAYGAKITRTMDLIQSSTAERRNKVRIQVYGQSHSKQEWTQILGEWLQQTWPNVDFEFRNYSIG